VLPHALVELPSRLGERLWFTQALRSINSAGFTNALGELAHGWQIRVGTALEKMLARRSFMVRESRLKPGE